MKLNPKSIRAFIGAKNYDISRRFYLDFGFKEFKTSYKMSYFYINGFGFYLQDAFIKDWIDNSMVFLEVENLESHHKDITLLELDKKYDNVKVTDIKYCEWGNEFFIYDPSGILWHIGEFKKMI